MAERVIILYVITWLLFALLWYQPSCEIDLSLRRRLPISLEPFCKLARDEAFLAIYCRVSSFFLNPYNLLLWHFDSCKPSLKILLNSYSSYTVIAYYLGPERLTTPCTQWPSYSRIALCDVDSCVSLNDDSICVEAFEMKFHHFHLRGKYPFLMMPKGRE